MLTYGVLCLLAGRIADKLIAATDARVKAPEGSAVEREQRLQAELGEMKSMLATQRSSE